MTTCLKCMLLICLLLTACNNGKKPITPASKKTTDSGNYSYSVTYKGYTKTSEHIRNDDTLRHYYDMLQGLWQNADDAGHFYYISGHRLYEISIEGGKADTTTDSFKLSYASCMEDRTERILENGEKNNSLYMQRSEDLCYSVDSLTPTRLELVYPDPGRVFIFNKK